MKTTKIWSKMLLLGMPAKATLVAMLVFGFVVVGCKDKSSPEGRGSSHLGQSFEIKNAKIYELDDDGKYKSLTGVSAVTVTGPFNSAPTATVTGGNTFSVTIPAADKLVTTATAANLYDFFHLDSADKITSVSPGGAKLGVLSLKATAPGYQEDLSLSTFSKNGAGYGRTLYTYVYVDKAVDIKGSEESSGSDENGTWRFITTVDLSLKPGWNVVEGVYKYDGKSLQTSTYSVKGIRESAKWSLEKDYGDED
ncbi:MAG: hypothetical protein Ta2A_15070 [Treponemataceae bacterium]|nr:MAG: hypothetical protein Ta2A_15070 [Treponemataceae bacterium]